MRIYPAIDLFAGDCVRLKQGLFSAKKIYSNDPLAMVELFEKQGFKFLHVIDLEGAKKARMQQYTLIAKILAGTSLTVQVGGGIRSISHVRSLLGAGAERVLVGSLAVTEQVKISQWLEKLGVNKIVLALDIKISDQPYLVIKGWQQSTRVSLWQLLDFYRQYPKLEILCTDTARDGLMSGPNFDFYLQCCERYPELNFIVSGGIRDAQDVQFFSTLPRISGVVLGTALYENKIVGQEFYEC